MSYVQLSAEKVSLSSVFTVKFYPDISARDQAIRIAMARKFRKRRKRKRFFGPRAIAREQILRGSDLCITRCHR